MVPGYLLENGYIVVKRGKHGLFMFNRNDNFLGRALDLYGEWCESEFELLLPFVRAGDTVVDVGANIGTHVVPFARAAGPGGRVIAFEPQGLSFHLLCANVAMNCLTNVQARQLAVGDAAGRINVPVIPPETNTNFAAVSLSAAGQGEEVEVITLDSLGLSGCRLIKIDVEGMEDAVIRGARDTIAAHRPVLFVENNTLEGGGATIAAIREAGYDAWWHLALYYNEANFYGNAKNIFATCKPEANLLCLPEGTDPGRDDLIECTGSDDNWRKALERGIAARNPRFFPKG